MDDTMVNSEDTVTSYDRTDYVTPVHLEVPTSNGITSSSSGGETPEYATITSRLRQHDPPSYLNTRNGSSSNLKSNDHDDDETDRADRSPDDDLTRSRDEEDKIEVLDTLLEDGSKEHEANGCPPGAGWTVVGAAALAGIASSGKSDDSSLSIAEKNSKILEQFEDKPREKDECIVDCIYYTTTCCECTIL